MMPIGSGATAVHNSGNIQQNSTQNSTSLNPTSGSNKSSSNVMNGKQEKGRKTWDAKAMELAVNAVRSKEMGYLKASKIYKVPRSTLVDYVKSDKPIEVLTATKLGRRPALSNEIENLLVTYCLDMEKRFYGLTASDIRRLAFQLAIRNGLQHPFSMTKSSAGKKWQKGFLKRHPELSFRKPQGVSAARIKGFTRENCAAFFDLLEPALAEIKLNPARLFNVDETGITTVQHKHSRVLSLRGKRQVGALTTSERGALVTVVTCMSATGIYVPPMLVFPRKNMKAELLNGAPPGTIARCHPSGWIQHDVFTAWLTHFIKHVKPEKDDPVVLILDGHYSHTRNIDLIDLARENYVHILCLPPHSTHKIQPLDVAFMSPFKTYYALEIESWLKNNPGRVVTHYQVAELLGRAYLRAASVEVAVNGFRKCGIFPFNRHVFRDDDFAIHSQRERTPPPPQQLDENRPESQEIFRDDDFAIHSQRERTPPPPQQLDENRPESQEIESEDEIPLSSLRNRIKTADAIPTKPSINSLTTPSTNRKLVKPADISPMPSCSYTSGSTNKRGRRGTTALITGSPYKSELEEALNKKKLKIVPISSALKGQNRSTKAKLKKNGKGKGKAKKPLTSSSDDDTDTELQLVDSDDDMDRDAEDAECLYCNNFYSEDRAGEKWIRCNQCFRWCHEECAGTDKNLGFICEMCLD